jgi:uroporphyrin-III C-methyltransferase/precorrin-2 dehydrogenase/sirohydrochlorin ferrochelatase/uroporphyrin-III C-methyltransferase
MSGGKVYLVGSGPGDPELLTVKALRLIQTADVVLYDRLVSKAILDLIPTGVSRIRVGKKSGHHCVPQAEINQLLVNSAQKNRQVVRLKGGDPYIFGRGSEEALALRAHGIKFEVVPGITSAAGCSAYAGIPLTHRGLSRSVQLLTGHFRDNEPLNVDWQKLADPQTTLVIYMGLANLDKICQSLIEAGLDASTPAAAVQNATTTRQRRVISNLNKLVSDVEQSELQSPVIIIIGQVVSLADQLDWFMSDLDIAEQQQAEQEAFDETVSA